MNNKLRILFCSLLATAAVCSLVAVGCDGEEKPAEHTHTYGEPQWTWAEDYGSAKVELSCTAGDDTLSSEQVESTYEVKTQPTCGAEGEGTYSVTATLNGNTYNDQKTVKIPATGEHTYGEPQWTWAEDYSSATATVTCSVCGNTVSENATVSTEKTDPTCADEGLAVYTANATLNGTDYSDAKEVTLPATGHTYGEPVWVWADDNSSASATITCSVCGDKATGSAETVYTVTVPATQQTEGKAEYTATVTLNGTEYSDKKEITLDVLQPDHEHTYGAPTWNWTADYSSVTATISCQYGDDDVSATAESSDITYEVTTEPTCTGKGAGKYTATVTLNGTEYTTVKEVEISETGIHTYGEPVWVWAEDYSSAKVTLTCLVCEEEKSAETSDISSETTKQPSCNIKGEVTYTAIVTIDGTEYVGTAYKTLPAEHDYQPVNGTLICSRCGNILFRMGDNRITIPVPKQLNGDYSGGALFVAEEQGDYTFAVTPEEYQGYYQIRTTSKTKENGDHYYIGDGFSSSVTITLNEGEAIGFIIINRDGAYYHATGESFDITVNVTRSDTIFPGEESNPYTIDYYYLATRTHSSTLAPGEKYYYALTGANYSVSVTVDDGFDLYLYDDYFDEYNKMENGTVFGLEANYFYYFYVTNTGSSEAAYELVIVQNQADNTFITEPGVYRYTKDASQYTSGLVYKIINNNATGIYTITISSDDDGQYISLMDDGFNEVKAGYNGSSYTLTAQLTGDGATNWFGLKYFGDKTGMISFTITLSADPAYVPVKINTSTTLAWYDKGDVSYAYMSFNPENSGDYYLDLETLINGEATSEVPTVLMNDIAISATNGRFKFSATRGKEYKFKLSYSKAFLNAEQNRVRTSVTVTTADDSGEDSNYQPVTFGENTALTITNNKAYIKFNVESPATYTLSLSSSWGTMFKYIKTSISVNGTVYNAEGSSMSYKTSYTFDVKQTGECKIIITYASAPEQHTYFAKVVFEDYIAEDYSLALGDNEVNEDVLYTFTSETGGDYIVTVSSANNGAALYANEKDFTPLLEEYGEENSSYIFNLGAGESTTFYTSNGGEGAFILNIANYVPAVDDGGDDTEAVALTAQTVLETGVKYEVSLKSDEGGEPDGITLNYTTNVTGTYTFAVDCKETDLVQVKISEGEELLAIVGYLGREILKSYDIDIAADTQLTIQFVQLISGNENTFNFKFTATEKEQVSNRFEVGETLALDENSVEKVVNISEAGNYILKFTFESGLTAKQFYDDQLYDGEFSIKHPNGGYTQYSYGDVKLSTDESYAYIEFTVTEGLTGDVNISFALYEITYAVNYSVVIEKL